MRCAKCGTEYADEYDGCPTCAEKAKQSKLTRLGCVLAISGVLLYCAFVAFVMH